MARERATLMEKAEAAMRASVASGGSLDADREAARERARAMGSLMSPGEVAERLGEESVELAVLRYSFQPGGRCEPPADMVVRCLPADLEGVRRSVAKLLESRGWSSRLLVSRTRVARSGIAGRLGEGVEEP